MINITLSFCLLLFLLYAKLLEANPIILSFYGKIIGLFNQISYVKPKKLFVSFFWVGIQLEMIVARVILTSSFGVSICGC